MYVDGAFQDHGVFPKGRVYELASRERSAWLTDEGFEKLKLALGELQFFAVNRCHKSSAINRHAMMRCRVLVGELWLASPQQRFEPLQQDLVAFDGLYHIIVRPNRESHDLV